LNGANLNLRVVLLFYLLVARAEEMALSNSLAARAEEIVAMWIVAVLPVLLALVMSGSQLGWADLWLIDSGLVRCRCIWIFVASATLFVAFIVAVATSGVGVMGNDWLVEEGHSRKSDRLFSSLNCCSALK
jgi:hypothetical protein